MHAVDLLTIAQVTTAVRGLVRPLAACYAGLTLRMLAPWPVHSACWIHLLAQVNHRSARIGTAPLATCYASLALCMPAPWPVHSACWSYLPAQVSTAVRGLVRLSRHLLYARLTFCMPAPWPVHSACWIYYILAQVTTPQCADWYGSLATCYARLTLHMPAPWPVHSACWFYFYTSSGNHTAVRGLVRLSRYLLC